MDGDELLARRLQQEFDEEARTAEARERKDALLAQKLAAGSHNLSDSEEEDEEEEEEEDRGQGRQRQLTLTPQKHKQEEEGKRRLQQSTSTHQEQNKSDRKKESSMLSSPKKGEEEGKRRLQQSTSLHQEQNKRDRKKESSMLSSPKKGEEEGKRRLQQSTSLHQEENKRDRKKESSMLSSPKKEEEEELKEGRGREGNSEHMLSEEEEEEEDVVASGRKEEGTPSSRQSHTSPQQHTDTPSRRPVCKYGAACYRKNPEHLRDFVHPSADTDTHTQGGGGGGGDVRGGGTSRGGGGGGGAVEKKEAERRKAAEKRESEGREERPSKKIMRGQDEESIRARDPFPVRLAASAPFRFFLNKCFSVKATQADPLTLVLPDLLHPDNGALVESAQLNFMVDLEFVMHHYKAAGADHKPLLIAYGVMEGDPKDYPALTCAKVKLPYQYGVHHTKAMLLLYPGGMRVVVHTANLVPGDWYEKTQGYWLSPLCPPLEDGRSGVLDGESPTRFKRDLVEYLQAYKMPELTRWATTVKRHDFTECNAVLVGSVPGYHTGALRDAWGHTKVRRVLAQHAAPPAPPRGHQHTTIVQCSSIGSLGKDHRSWLTAELGLSLAGHKSTSATVLPASLPKVCVVYPSQEDVRTSSQGWEGGSCLPYNSGTHEKQPWLTQHLQLWRSESRGRTRAMPHIKTYTRVNSDLQHAHYLLLTSANLSKAAWGCLQKEASQLFIRSYELGVLLLPKFVTGGSEFSVSPSGSPPRLALPYDLPLTPYPSSAVPWFMNTTKKEKDVLGRTYP